MENIGYGLTSTRIPIRPTLGPDHSKLVTLQPQSYIDPLLINEEFKQTFTAKKQELQAMHEIAKTGHTSVRSSSLASEILSLLVILK